MYATLTCPLYLCFPFRETGFQESSSSTHCPAICEPGQLGRNTSTSQSESKMSSRRKSTTPCMVLPSDVVEQEAVEEKPERTKEDEAGDEEEEEERKGKEATEELGQAVVVVPTPPDAGKALTDLSDCGTLLLRSRELRYECEQGRTRQS